MAQSSELIFELIQEFCKEPHGSTNYGKDEVYVQGKEADQYAPLSFLKKKIEDLSSEDDLLKLGFIYNSYDIDENPKFASWYKGQFAKVMPSPLRKKALVLHIPEHKQILDCIQIVHDVYDNLRNHSILINGKNLPIQIGEWYAKSIFGLKQVRSSSQRGFDFLIGNKRVEVKVHWNDKSSPKGAKIRKSLVRLSDYIVVMYVAKDFTIRDICFLDSDFVERKFDGKGHTIFLKDPDLSQYFFSNSTKHFDKIKNKTTLMKFSNPMFALKLEGRLDEV